jgi:ribosomal protein S12
MRKEGRKAHKYRWLAYSRKKAEDEEALRVLVIIGEASDCRKPNTFMRKVNRVKSHEN